MAVKDWCVLESRELSRYRVFSIRCDRVISPRTGKEHEVYLFESPPWVNVVALTPKEELVLVRQYRHGIRQVTLEIPGGVVEKGDSPLQAAQRELLEETGYQADSWSALGYVHPNPAIQNNRCHTFLARNAVPTGRRHLDEMEDIEVILKPLSQIPHLITNGTISHALIVAALCRFLCLGSGNNEPGMRIT